MQAKKKISAGLLWLLTFEHLLTTIDVNRFSGFLLKSKNHLKDKSAVMLKMSLSIKKSDLPLGCQKAEWEPLWEF